MIYGIEQSTDLCTPFTRIRRFRSRKQALAWQQGGGHFTYSDPDGARNYHHTLRELYEMPSGWRPPPAQHLDSEARKSATPTYPRNRNDMLARRVRREGEELPQ